MAETKKSKTKSAWKTCSPATNIMAADVYIAGREIRMQVDELSDISFIKGLRLFNAGFLY